MAHGPQDPFARLDSLLRLGGPEPFDPTRDEDEDEQDPFARIDSLLDLGVDPEVPPPQTEAPPSPDPEAPAETRAQGIMANLQNLRQRVAELFSNATQADQERQAPSVPSSPEQFLQRPDAMPMQDPLTPAVDPRALAMGSQGAGVLPLPQQEPSGVLFPEGRPSLPVRDLLAQSDVGPRPGRAPTPPPELRTQGAPEIAPHVVERQLADQAERDASQRQFRRLFASALGPGGQLLTGAAAQAGEQTTPGAFGFVAGLPRATLEALGAAEPLDEGARPQRERTGSAIEQAGEFLGPLALMTAEVALTRGALAGASRRPDLLGRAAQRILRNPVSTAAAEDWSFVLGDIAQQRDPAEIVQNALLGTGVGGAVESVLRSRRLGMKDLRSMATTGRLDEISPRQWRNLVNDLGDDEQVGPLVTGLIRDARPDLADDLLGEVAEGVRVPGDMVPAWRTPEGEIVAGRRGGIHAVIAQKEGLDPSASQAGFLSEETGFLSRDEARERFGVSQSGELALAQGVGVEVSEGQLSGLGRITPEDEARFAARVAEEEPAGVPGRGETVEQADDLPFLEGARPEDVRRPLTPETPEVPSAAIEPERAPLTGEPEAVEEVARRTGVGQGGYFDLASTVSSVKGKGRDFFERFESLPFVRRYLTSAGDVPKEAHRRILRADAEFASLVQQAEFNLRSLNRVMAEDPDIGARYVLANSPEARDVKRRIHLVANGTEDISTLPDRYHDITRTIARDRRLLAKRLQDEGVVQGALAASFADNGDMFLSRVYRVFEDDNYVDTFQRRLATGDPQAHKIKNNVVRLIREQMPHLDDAEVNVRLNMLLGGESGTNPMYTAAPIRQTALSMTKTRRGFVPSELARRTHDILDPDLGADVVDGAIQAMKDGDWQSDAWAQVRTALDASDVDGAAQVRRQLEDRFGIAPEIRALWGEVEDISITYPRTMANLARYITTHKMLDDLADMGQGKYFFGTAEDAVRALGVPVGKVRKLAGEASEAWQPMADKLGGDGVYVLKDIADAIERPFQQHNPGTFMKWMFRASSLVKGNVTVGQVGTQVRNFVGGNTFMMFNGHLNLWDLHKYPAKMGRAATIAASGVRTTENVTRAGRTVKEFLGRVAELPEEEARAVFRRYQELGLVGEDAVTTQLQAELKAANWEDFGSFMDNLGSRLFGRVGRGGTQTGAVVREAVGVYRATDDMLRIVSFENDLRDYTQAIIDSGREVPDDIERQVARITQDTYQNYALSPAWVHTLSSRVPFFGVFPAFAWQMFRTTYNSLKYMTRELDDPVLHSIGRRRALGMVQVATLTAGVPAAAQMMNGISEEDDRMLRRFMPKWERNASIWYTSPLQGGQFSYINTSYTNPYSTFADPMGRALRAITAGEEGRASASLPDMAWETFLSSVQILEPFVAEDILTGYVRRAASNVNEYGHPISDHNPERDPLPYYSDLMGYVFTKALTPGVARELQRVYEATQEHEIPGGFQRDVPNELRAMFLGVRGRTGNVASHLRFEARDYSNDVASAERRLNRVFADRGSVTDEDLVEAWEASELERRELFDEMHELSILAQSAGVSEEAVVDTWRSARGFSEAEAYDIVRGTYSQRRVDDGFMAGAEESALAGVTNPVERFDIQREFARRRDLLMRLARGGR